MSQTNYPACLVEVFKHEGGYVNHPKDPGGATNHGITIAVARQYWKADASAEDMRHMPKAVAAAIYKKQYWDKVSGDVLPEGIDLCTFDAAVNSGTGRADKWLAKALNAPLRPYAELARLALNVTDKAAVVKKYCDTRLGFLQSLKTWGTFGKGWTRRVASVKATGLAMALEAAGKPVDEVKKDLATEVAQHDKKLQADTVTASTGGSVTGGATLAFDGGLIIVALIALAVTIFLAHRIYTHVVAKDELRKAIANVGSQEQVQNLKRELLDQGPVLRDDDGGQVIGYIYPKEP